MTKIIDSKGRIFGAINVIDFFVILVLISFVPIVVIGYKFIGRKHNILDTQWVSVQIKLTGVEPEFINVISKGDADKDPSGKVIGTVTSIAKLMPSKVWVIVDNKMLSTIDHPVQRDVTVEANILCTDKKGILYYKLEPVKIGSKIMFETDKYNIPGIIVGFKVRDK